MRVLIIADEIFASRERALLSRLEVGLADEGVGVVQALPESAPANIEGTSFFNVSVRFSPPFVPFARPLAARRLIDQIRIALRTDALPSIEIVHVFGGEQWNFAGEVAEQLQAHLVLEVWRTGLLERANSFHNSNRGARLNPLHLAPDAAIEKTLQKSSLNVRPAYWGVHAPMSPRTKAFAGGAVTAVMIGSGRDAKAFHAALQGTAEALSKVEVGVILCDAQAARRAGLWATATQLGILDRFTLIEGIESRSDLLMHADLLIHPESFGEQRSIVLEAMGAGVLVVAAADKMNSTLIDGRTARLVDVPTPDAWRVAVQSLLNEPAMSHNLITSAWQYIRSNRLASGHVRQVLAAYEWIRAEEPIPLRTGTDA